MVALQIRDVPEDVRDVLAERARARGQSLQSYLLSLVQDDARRARNAAVLRRVAARGGGSRAKPGQTAAELADARARRSDEQNVH